VSDAETGFEEHTDGIGNRVALFFFGEEEKRGCESLGVLVRTRALAGRKKNKWLVVDKGDIERDE
jgi:hypothetical protein